MGAVYEAIDAQSGETVALKTLPAASHVQRLRFRREFRRASELPLHPHLVAMYQLFERDELCWFTMEHVDGVDIRTWLQRFEGRPDFLTEVRRVFRDVVLAIRHLHAHGLVHRDLKPSNVLVDRFGRPVVLDFGISQRDARLGETNEAIDTDSIAGTVPYIAPEQAQGDAIRASDWYSLGVMLFEALTGELPFTGPSYEVLWRKQQEDARPACSCASVPADLAELCDRLLVRDPDARPRGEEIFAVLHDPRHGAPAPREASDTTPVVGRTEELETLLAQVTGDARLVLLRGAPGIGKTTVLRQFRRRLGAEGRAEVFSGRCHQREQLPHQGLDGVMSGLAAWLGRHREVRPELTWAQRGALVRMFPVFEAVYGASDTPTLRVDREDASLGGGTVGRTIDAREQALQAIHQLLRCVASHGPVVVVIDDLQWADAATIQLLQFMSVQPSPPPVLGVFAMRTDRRELAPEMLRLLATYRGPRVLRVPLGGLTDPDANDLVTQVVAGAPVSQSFLQGLVVRAGGNPLYLAQYAWFAAHEASGTLRDADLDTLIGWRLSRLPPPIRLVLELLVVYGEPVPPVDLLAVADDGPTMRMLLDIADEALIRLVRPAHDPAALLIDFHHDEVRRVVGEQLDDERRQALHARIAAHLERCSDGGPADFRLFEHYRRAGEVERAGHIARRAAERAMAALAFDRAADLYGYAAEMAEAETVRATLERRRCEALISAGRGYEAGAGLMALAERGSASALKDRRRAAEQYLASGHIDEGLAVIFAMLPQGSRLFERSHVRLLLSILWSRLRVLVRGGTRSIGLPPRALESRRTTHEEVLWSAVYNLSVVNPIRLVPLQSYGFLWALRRGSPCQLAQAVAVEGALSATSGPLFQRRTRRLQRHSVALAEAIGSPSAMARALAWNAFASMCLGDFAEAVTVARQAEGLLREHGVDLLLEANNNVYALYQSRYLLGDVATFPDEFEILKARATRQQNVFLETFLDGWMSWVVAIQRGEVGPAYVRIARVRERWRGTAFDQMVFLTLWGRAELALFEGDDALAARLVQEEWRELGRTLLTMVGVVGCGMHHMHGRLQLRLAERETGPARVKRLRGVARDARWVALTGMPHAKPWSRTLRAGARLVEGRGDEAAALLRHAEQELLGLGLMSWYHAVRMVRAASSPASAGEATFLESWRALRAGGFGDPLRFAVAMVPGATARVTAVGGAWVTGSVEAERVARETIPRLGVG